MNTDYSDITLEINGILSAPYKDGDILKNRYRILSQDSGGQSQIYFCFDLWSQVPCALKASGIQKPDALQAELQNLLNLPSHKNVVKLYRLEQIQSEYYIVMEWLPNSLKSLLAGSMPVPAEKTATIALSVCLGMIHCQKHLSQPKKPFVHGNLKPSNLLFTQEGNVKITDFGTSRLLQDSSLSPDSGFQAEQTASQKNRPYAPPALNANVLDDIFSLGKIMEELFLCGKKEQQLTCTYPAAGKKSPPPLFSQEQQLARLIQNCTAELPQNRTPSFEKLADELLEFLHLPSDFSNADSGCYSPEERNWLKVQACDQAILGEYQKADQILSRLTESGEERDKEFLAGACCSLGDVYRKQSMYERALPLYEKAIAYDQDRNSYLWTNKGIVLCRMDRREEAYQCFCRALAINPYDFSAIKNEIDILRSQGRTHELKKARVRLFSLYRQQPEAEELLKHIGNACYALKDFEPARTCYDKYLEYNRNDWETIYHYAMCLYLDRDITHARNYFQRAVRMMEENIADEEQSKLMYLSISLYHLGDYYQSMEYLNKYRRRFGSSSQTKRLKLLLELDCQLQEKYGPLLSDVYRQLTSVIFAKDPRNHYMPILEQLNSMKKYWERSKITQTLAGHACDMYLSCLDYLMACYEGLGQTEHALACCDQILSFDRSLPEGLYNKGRNLLLAEKAYEALPYFQAALRFQQDSDTGRQIEESLRLAQQAVENSAECRNLFLKQIMDEAGKSGDILLSLQRILDEKSFFLTEDFPNLLKNCAKDRIKQLTASFCAAASSDMPMQHPDGNVWKFLLQVLKLANALQQIPGEQKDICAGGALSLYQLLEEYAAEIKSDFTENLTQAKKDLSKSPDPTDKAVFAEANTELGDLLMEKYLDTSRPQEMLKEAAKCYQRSLSYYRPEKFPQQYAFLMLRMSILMEKRYRLQKDHSLHLARVYFSQVSPKELPAQTNADAMYRQMEQVLQ